MRVATLTVCAIVLFGLAGRMDRDDARRIEAERACRENWQPYVGIEAQCIRDYYEMKGW